MPTTLFQPGNKQGRGNPFTKKTQRLRAELYRSVSKDDIRDVVKKLIEMAKDGDIHAIKELLDRCLGRSTASVQITFDDAKQRAEEMTDAELLQIVHCDAKSRRA